MVWCLYSRETSNTPPTRVVTDWAELVSDVLPKVDL